MPSDEWEFRHFLHLAPAPDEQKWSGWLPVSTGMHNVIPYDGVPVVEFRRKPQKCQAWLDLADTAAPGSVDDEPGYRIACDITPGEKHPIVRDPTAPTEWTRVHRAGSVWWADGNVPKDAEDDDA